jgi:multisubunit Na+/H+ antiporter MnhG subunit
MTKPKRLKFAVVMTGCGVLIELAAIALIAPGSTTRVPWLLQAATGLIFFYVLAPWATMRLRLFRSEQS